jgi:hypothetical protein
MDRSSSRLWLGVRLVWAPLSVLVVHRYAGAAWGHEPYIDPVIHTCGGLAMAHMLSILIVRAQESIGRLTALGRDLMVFGLTAFVTLAWEVGEYFLSAYYHAHLQRSIAETIRDMVLGVMGATVYLIVARFTRK